MFADFNTGDIGLDRLEGASNGVGRIGFEIPRIEMTRSANQEQQDAIDVLAAGFGFSLKSADIRKLEADGPGGQAAHAKEIAARQTVAQIGRACCC